MVSWTSFSSHAWNRVSDSAVMLNNDTTCSMSGFHMRTYNASEHFVIHTIPRRQLSSTSPWVFQLRLCKFWVGDCGMQAAWVRRRHLIVGILSECNARMICRCTMHGRCCEYVGLGLSKLQRTQYFLQRLCSYLVVLYPMCLSSLWLCRTWHSINQFVRKNTHSSY